MSAVIAIESTTVPYIPIWKVADFGITTAGTSKSLIATDNKRGTVHYLAPEIILAQPGVPSYTNKVDIWSLGAILYELWTGKRAFPMVFTKFLNVLIYHVVSLEFCQFSSSSCGRPEKILQCIRSHVRQFRPRILLSPVMGSRLEAGAGASTLIVQPT